MGQERTCRIDYDGKTFEGKALLETSEVIVRGATRLRIPFKAMTRVEAEGGKLHIVFPPSEATLHIGDAAAKWAQKILNPPSRLDKIGVASGVRIRWIGPSDAEFKNEAAEAGAVFVRSAPDITFLAARDVQDLGRIEVTDHPLWIVYPKGVSAIRESDVLKAGRAAGLTDIKVASFSPTHTALKFVARKAAARKSAAAR